MVILMIYTQHERKNGKEGGKEGRGTKLTVNIILNG